MRTLCSWRLAHLAPLAYTLCATAALAQALPPTNSVAASQSTPSLFPSYAPGANNQQPLGSLAAAPETPTGEPQPTEDWFKTYVANSTYSAGPNPGGVCDDSPPRGIIAFVGYDSFRGVSDGSWQNNGINSGINFGTRLGQFSDLTGIGFQIGASAAAYDWAGAEYRLTHANQAEPQGFVTYGLFRKANEYSDWSAAVVQDWMLNANYGVFGQNPTLSQWRGQLGYALNDWNELGIWGTWRARGDTRDTAFGSTSWRSINQFNVFAHHKWGPGGADTAMWVGVPEHDRLGGNGSLGDYIIGLFGNFPISESVAVYTLITYMHDSAAAGGVGSAEDAWNFTIGAAIYPARNARSTTVVGQCWMPQLPVANNGYFMVDTNHSFY